MGILLIVIITIILSAVWLRLWTSTYHPKKTGHFIAHTSVFALFSLLILLAVAFLIFSAVDETYSAANKSALGLVFLMIASIFGVACIVAFMITLSSLLEKHSQDKENENKSFE